MILVTVLTIERLGGLVSQAVIGSSLKATVIKIKDEMVSKLKIGLVLTKDREVPLEFIQGFKASKVVVTSLKVTNLG